MSLAERLKRWRGLSLLRGRVRKTPSPAAYADLCERLIALGEADDAVRTADAGLLLYPDSDRLAHVRLFVMKGRLSGRIRKLREDVLRRPHPGTYGQLAQLYRELGSDDDALAISAECCERFPANEAAYMTQGEVRFDRFRRDLIARDAVIAEAALRQVVRINEQNAAAHARLAEIYWLVGLPAACCGHLAHVLALTPGARGVEEFTQGLDRLPAPAAPAEPFADLAARVQQTRAFANDPARFPRSGPGVSAQRVQFDQARIGDAMNAFSAHAGLRNAALFGEDGALVSDYCGASGLTAAEFGELVTGIRDVADDATRRMDTGGLVRAEIEGPGGNVLVTRARGLTVALLYSAPLAQVAALALVEDFTARLHGAGAGAGRA